MAAEDRVLAGGAKYIDFQTDPSRYRHWKLAVDGEIAKEQCYCPVDATILPGAGHSPHREAPETTLDAIAEFAARILVTHEGGQGRAA